MIDKFIRTKPKEDKLRMKLSDKIKINQKI